MLSFGRRFQRKKTGLPSKGSYRPGYTGEMDGFGINPGKEAMRQNASKRSDIKKCHRAIRIYLYFVFEWIKRK